MHVRLDAVIYLPRRLIMHFRPPFGAFNNMNTSARCKAQSPSGIT